MALDHQETDRVPVSLGFGVNQPVVETLQERLGLDSVSQVQEWLLRFSDIRKVAPRYIGPSLRRYADGRLEDYWGVIRKPVSYGTGFYHEIDYYPLANIEDVSQLDAFRWPSVDWWDFGELAQQIAHVRQEQDYAIQFGNGNLFESSWYMRGFERFFTDLVLNPELAHEILRRVTDFHISFLTTALQAAEGAVDIVMTADDIAGQNGLLMSLAMWEEFLRPYHVRMNEALHEYGVRILYHSDGAVMQAVPYLMEAGIDILEALQFDAKDMDPQVLKEAYGHALCFHGGISVQQTLPFGSVEEVREEVKERIRVLGRQGGYILAPSHAIQAGTPPENVVAMLETAWKG